MYNSTAKNNCNTKSDFKISWWSGFGIVLRIVFLIIVLYTITLLAWVGDDAHITFRQVWNFVNGKGIVYYLDTRVHAFSHPLWFLLLSSIVYFTKEIYLTTIFLSITLSFFAITLLVLTENNVRKDKFTLLSPMYLLLFSWAFFDYTSSGLENPLSYLLVGCLLYLLSKPNFMELNRQCFVLLALLIMTRLDFALIFIPFAIVYLINLRNFRKIVSAILPGTILLLVWHTFSTFYFGSPLPNTFYAKLLAGYSNQEYNLQGIEYYKHLKYDIATIFIIVLGVLFSILSKNRFLISIGIGILFYLYYILQAGGDFMVGRFFSVPVFLSVGVMIIASKSVKFSTVVNSNWTHTLILITAILIGMSMKFPFLASRDQVFRYPVDWLGIVDERTIFYRQYGLLSIHRFGWPNFFNSTFVKPEHYRILCGGIGVNSLKRPDLYSLDLCGLIDPFIARIPAAQLGKWRPGHHERKIPTDFGDFVLGNKEKQFDDSLNELFRDVDLATRKDLFTLGRVGAIWRLNTGFDYKVNWSKYSDGNVFVPNTSQFNQITLESWNAPIGSGSVREHWYFKSKTPKEANRIWVDLEDSYEYEVYINDKLISVVRYGYDCLKGTLVHLPNTTMVESISFKAVDMIPNRLSLGSEVKFLVVLGGREHIPEPAPYCTYNSIEK